MEAVGTLEQALSGSYEIESVLGRGGSATVYLARDLRHGRRVALKVLRPELSASLGSGRFVREIQIGARLQHPHILPLYESGEAGGFVYYSMPYVEGENLRQRIAREGPLRLDQVVRIIHDVSEALSYAHERGVIHRDVKPENILLTNGHALVADFGIARALSLAGGERLTSSGVAVGTPAYMSPEQGTGKVEVDARSDVYSLGCVLHEMLAGEPPFTGPTPQAVIARHVSERPPSLRVVRPNVDRAVERVVEVALAKVPADRFASVKEFSDTLTLAASGVYPLALRAPRRRWRIGLAVGVVAMVLAAVIGFRAIGAVSSGLDPSQHVVAPFLGDVAAASGVDPDVLAYEFTAAMRQVPDIGVIDGPRLNDVVLQVEPGDFDGWRTAARRVAAGNLVPLSIIVRGDSVDLVAELYDAGSGGRERRASVTVAGGTDLVLPARRLAELLFRLPPGSIDPRGTESPEARRAFIAAKRAMQTWDLERAEGGFLEAAELDPQFAPASFWLAQIRSWRNEPPETWRGHARNAVAAGDRLADRRERALAAALLAMAEGRHPQACEEYEALLAADSLDFQAWFGLGECHGRDHVVVPDTASPSGWRFRASYHAAVEAYKRALELVPSFMFAFREEAFDRLSRMLFAEPNMLQYGSPVGQDTLLFLSAAGLDADTLAFIPYPAIRVFAGAQETLPPSRADAIESNRADLLETVRLWATAFPDSSKPLIALTRALELARQLDGGGQQGSALQIVQRARATASSLIDSLQATTVEARILLKLERFDEAAELAREALDATVTDPAHALELAGLAAVVGRAHAAVRYATIALAVETGRELASAFGPPVLEARQRLLTYAAFGAPQDSVAALASRLDTALALYTNTAPGRALVCQMRSAAMARAYPVVRRTTSDPECWQVYPWLEAQWALEQGETSTVRSVLTRLDQIRSRNLPGDVATLDAYLEARALLALADTSGATARLEAVLTALPVLRTDLLPDVQQMAGLVRVMGLRADLASRLGSDDVASRWAAAVVALWENADEDLQPHVNHMREILSAR